MTYEVSVTDTALKDLEDIHAYIAFELGSPAIASEQVRRIKEKVLSLSGLPRRYPRFRRELWQGSDLRRMVVDRFVVFYEVDDAAQTVFVNSILYGPSDLESRL